MFDAGSLIFAIKTAGARVAEQELRSFEQAAEKTGRSAKSAAKDTDQLGTATDAAGKKARGAKAPLDDQAKSTDRVGDANRRAKPDVDKTTASAEQQAEAARGLSVALLAAGVAVTALVGLSVAKFATFDQQMSSTAAAAQATAAEQRALGDAALQAGADTAFSATEAAAAQEELAKAGLSTSNILDGSLNASLALAAAGQLEVARSAEIMATTLKQFRLPGEQAGKVADLLAAGAGKAQGTVDDLALALQYVGPVAAGLGFTLEETTGTLALFASQGQLGERAGTGLRGVLQSLVSPSQLANKELEKYNISVFDGQGKMKSLAAISEELRRAYAGLTEEERSASLGRIFGNEQITAARVLYEGGAKAVEEWTAAVDDSGFAAELAAKRQDNLAGDIEKLGGSFDTALIKTGSGANDVLRGLVQTTTALVDGFGALDPAVQGGVLVLGVATGAVLLFSGAVFGTVGRVAELKRNLDLANISLGGTARIAGVAGLALAGVLTVIGLIATAQAEARARAQAYADTLEEGTNRMTDATRDLAKENLAAERSYLWISRGSAFDAAEKLGLSLTTVTDAATGNADALRELDGVLRAGQGNVEEAQRIANEYGLTLGEVSSITSLLAEAVLGEASSLEEAIRVAEQKDKVTEEGIPVTESAADAYLTAASGADELTDSLDELITKILEANGIGQDAISANLDYKNALAEVDEVIRKATEGLDENEDGIADYILTLDESTQAGRDNKQMLVDLADQAQEAARKQFELDGNTQNYRSTLESSRQALIDRAKDLGYNADEAEALADQIFRIPSETEWEVIAQTRNAQAALDTFLFTNNGRTITLNVDTVGRRTSVGSGVPGGFGFADGGVVEFYAGGGMREHHVAQIARAGAMRVWAEPETGGEAYIPLSPTKRGTSVPVLYETADRMGFDVVPRGARYFADGGVAGRGAGAGGVHYHEHLTLPIVPRPDMPMEQQIFRAADALTARIARRRRPR